MTDLEVIQMVRRVNLGERNMVRMPGRYHARSADKESCA